MPPTNERSKHDKHDANCYVSVCRDRLDQLLDIEAAASRLLNFVPSKGATIGAGYGKSREKLVEALNA